MVKSYGKSVYARSIEYLYISYTQTIYIYKQMIYKIHHLYYYKIVNEGGRLRFLNSKKTIKRLGLT